MLFDDILSKVPKAALFLQNLRKAYDQGLATVNDILDLGTFIETHWNTFQNQPYETVKELLNAVGNGQYENKYRELVSSLPIEDLLQFHRSSIQELKNINNRKIEQLNMIRMAIELPQKVISIFKYI